MKRYEKILIAFFASCAMLAMAFMVIRIIMKLWERWLLKTLRPVVLFIIIFVWMYHSIDKFDKEDKF